MTDTTKPRLYVGTYAKYNNGSIAGEWVDLEQFDNETDFYKHCKKLHKDESDPEFMFQDFEGFPGDMYSESGIDDRLFEFIAMDQHDREIVNAGMDYFGQDEDLECIKDHYFGKYEKEIDLAYELIEQGGYLNECPDIVKYHFDYESYARDLFIDGFAFCDGFVFSTNSEGVHYE